MDVADVSEILRYGVSRPANIASIVSDPTEHSLDRARDLSNTAWRLRGAAVSSGTSNQAESEEATCLVRQQLAEAVALCRKAGADRESATALRRLGHAEQDAGRNDAATVCYEEAVAAARRTGDPLLLAHAIRHLGDAHRSTGRLAGAEAWYDEALGLYAEHSDPPPLDYANALRPTAIVKEELGKTDDARHLWQRAKALYAAVPIAAGVAECDENLARLG